MSAQGCQLIRDYQFLSKEQPSRQSEAEKGHDQMFSLLRQGKRYSELSKQEQRVVCKQLTLDYQQHKDWQTAWLLIYALNQNFTCVSQSDTVILLQKIEKNTEVSPSLQWLNTNQIELLKKLNTLQIKVNSFQIKNHNLKSQLNEAEEQLQDVISKIQALKVIETTINQKTQ